MSISKSVSAIAPIGMWQCGNLNRLPKYMLSKLENIK